MPPALAWAGPAHFGSPVWGGRGVGGTVLGSQIVEPRAAWTVQGLAGRGPATVPQLSSLGNGEKRLSRFEGGYGD